MRLYISPNESTTLPLKNGYHIYSSATSPIMSLNQWITTSPLTSHHISSKEPTHIPLWVTKPLFQCAKKNLLTNQHNFQMSHHISLVELLCTSLLMSHHISSEEPSNSLVELPHLSLWVTTYLLRSHATLLLSYHIYPYEPSIMFTS